MILTIDVGNTTIQGGLFEGEKSVLQFRRSTNASLSSEELGLFLRDVIRLNTIRKFPELPAAASFLQSTIRSQMRSLNILEKKRCSYRQE